jgi:iron complex transport system ATP-binding protein
VRGDLHARNLSADLGRRRVLAAVDLTLQPGLLTVVIGPNGAGKSTLLRALAGLQPAAAGTVLLGDRPVAALASGERARAIAYLPQGGSIAWPLPVAHVVTLGRLPHGERPGALRPVGRAAVAAALAAVGLAGFEGRVATELSGGERARVLLARALATNSPVLLADEPVAALDPRHQLVVLDVLKSRARGGATVVAVMHDLALAARFADRLVLLAEGRVRAEGAPAAVLTEAELARSFGIETRVTIQDERVAITPLRPLTIDENRNSS